MGNKNGERPSTSARLMTYRPFVLLLPDSVAFALEVVAIYSLQDKFFEVFFAIPWFRYVLNNINMIDCLQDSVLQTNIPIDLETLPNGGAINIEVYGGTLEASKSP